MIGIPPAAPLSIWSMSEHRYQSIPIDRRPSLRLHVGLRAKQVEFFSRGTPFIDFDGSRYQLVVDFFPFCRQVTVLGQSGKVMPGAGTISAPQQTVLYTPNLKLTTPFLALAAPSRQSNNWLCDVRKLARAMWTSTGTFGRMSGGNMATPKLFGWQRLL